MGIDLSQIDEDAVFIIGAGHFGARAARIIRQRSNAPVVVVDPNEKGLSSLGDLRVEKIQDDGIRFLLDNFHYLTDANTIVPALPIHLAYEWLIQYLPKGMKAKKVPVPETNPPLPHACPASEGSTLVSYADFLCPDDCPEPVYCTVTGEKRDQPLYALLRNLHLPLSRVHIVRSHQLAPGLGGYKAGDLRETAEKVMTEGATMWILGTSCKCHGILTAFELNILTQSHKDTECFENKQSITL
jgi:hypothetical protein